MSHHTLLQIFLILDVAIIHPHDGQKQLCCGSGMLQIQQEPSLHIQHSMGMTLVDQELGWLPVSFPLSRTLSRTQVTNQAWLMPPNACLQILSG